MIKKFLIIILVLISLLAVSGVSAAICGNSICETDENDLICPIDCGDFAQSEIAETSGSSVSYTDLSSGVVFTLETTNTGNKSLYGNADTVTKNPVMIDMIFGIGSTSSTTVTISGFKANTQYYLYKNGYSNPQSFFSDASGKYSFTQDTSSGNHIWIQDRPSTKFLVNDATGGDCNFIGNWNAGTNTCTLTTDLTESVQIDGLDFNLDCAGKSITGSGSGFGIYLNDTRRATVKNCQISNFNDGVYMFFLRGTAGNKDNVLDSNTITGNVRYGVYMVHQNRDIIIRNTLSNNGHSGIFAFVSSSNTITENTLNNNGVNGIYTFHSSRNILTNNHASGNPRGIFADISNIMTITGNVLENNDNGLFLFRPDFLSIVENNIMSNNDIGVVISSQQGVTIKNNLIKDNRVYGIFCTHSQKNLIYNNLFNNTVNFGEHRCSPIGARPNQWNISKTVGTNIIGETFLGGNFWAEGHAS